MRIRSTLIIGFVSCAAIVVAIALVLVTVNFQRGVDAYLQARLAADFEPSRQVLAQSYAQTENWERWSNKRHLLMSVIEANLTDKARYGILDGITRLQPGQPPSAESFLSKRDSRRRPPPGGHRADRPPPPKPGKPPINFGLADAQGLIIIAPSERIDTQKLPITANGKTIGYLLVPSTQAILTDYDQRFGQDQLQALPWIGLLAIICATVIALILTTFFVNPIKQLLQHARQLTSGKFEPTELHARGELGDLSRQLNVLAKTLASNEARRRSWLADISHELRTPIAVLRGELEALEDGVRPLNLDAVESLTSEVQRLQKLVEDLYQLSDTEIGGIRYQKSDHNLSELIEEVIERHGPSLQQKSIGVSADIAPNIWGHIDELRITQVLDNLLTNTLKYTDSNGQLEITLGQNQNILQVCISDSAPGVNSHELNQLFDHLYRTDGSRNRATGGSGLGLAICKRIIDAHEGAIAATHSSLGGITITINLPTA